MGTRCAIIVKIEDNLYEGVYVHWDGDLEGTGKTLLQHYNADDLARGLVSLGYLSTVAGSKWSGVISKSVEPQREHILELLGKHTWGAPQPDLVIAYARERGEARRSDKGSLSQVSACLGQGHGYVWDGEKWMIGSSTLADAVEENERC